MSHQIAAPAYGLAPGAVSSGTSTGETWDLLAQPTLDDIPRNVPPWDEVYVLINETGVFSDGSFQWIVEHGADGTSWSDAAALCDPAPPTTTEQQVEPLLIRYHGVERFLRVRVVGSDAAVGELAAATLITLGGKFRGAIAGQ